MGKLLGHSRKQIGPKWDMSLLGTNLNHKLLDQVNDIACMGPFCGIAHVFFLFQDWITDHVTSNNFQL